MQSKKQLREAILEEAKKRNFYWSSVIKSGLADGYAKDGWKDSLVGRFAERFPSSVKLLIHLRGVVMHTPKWDDINDDTLLKLRQRLLRNEKKSSVKLLLNNLKKFISDSITERLIPPSAVVGFEELLSIELDAERNIYLDEKEIEMIHQYQPKNAKMFNYKSLFMISAYTGASLEDCKNISIDNCDLKSNTLIYKKAGKDIFCSVPIHRNLKLYLPKDCITGTLMSSINDSIREIIFNAGVRSKSYIYIDGVKHNGYKYDLAVFNTARRSFATNLYNRGVDVSIIASMMGTTIRQLSDSIICSSEVIDDRLKGFFD